MDKQIAIVLVSLLCSPFLAFALPGTAKFYPDGSKILSPCNRYFQRALYVAKASDEMWENGAACGKYYCVVCKGAVNPSEPSPCKGINGSIVVNIRAYCPNCDSTISISKDAFATIAHPNASNIIEVDYVQIQSENHTCA